MKGNARLFQYLFLLICCVTLFACSDIAEEEETASLLGNGSGGVAVSANLITRDITKSSGELIGTYQYDGDVFLEVFSAASSAETVFLILSDITGSTITVTAGRIIGRPDTACRYQAAVMARDLDYEIEDTALKKNAEDIEFYKVSVSKSGAYVDLYCATLSDQIGVSFIVSSSSVEAPQFQQVFSLLNSVTLN